MRVRAVRPLVRQAVIAADKLFYANHPEMIRNGRRIPIDPCSPKHAKLREEWIRAYARSGGKLEPARGPEQACIAREVKQKTKTAPNRKVAKPVAGCPTPPRKSAPPPQMPPKQDKPQPIANKPCKLLGLKLTCQHGRTAGPEGILMVVPASDFSLTDTIKGSMSFEGGCGDHPAWLVDGFLNKEGKGTSFSFGAKSVAPSLYNFVTLNYVAPQSYSVSGSSCGGSRSHEVRAYPSGTVSGSISFTEIKRGLMDKIEEVLKKIPIKSEKWTSPEFQWLVGSIQYEATWKEDAGTWTAHCERTLSGGFDPVFSVGSKFPLVGVPLPKFIANYANAGIFIELEGSISSMISLERWYFPHTGKSERKKTEGNLQGSVEGALVAELVAFSEETVSASAKGVTEVFCKGSVAKEEDFALEIECGISGLHAKFSLKLGFGILGRFKPSWLEEAEFEKEYEIFGDLTKTWTWQIGS